MNVLTFELCAEDRARLDRLIAVQEATAVMLQALLGERDAYANAATQPIVAAPAPVPAADPVPAAPVEDVPPFEVAPPAVPVAPAVTLEQIQKKATQIAAGSAAKKAKLRGIVNQYAPKVTDLPEGCWAAVWDALCALEAEA